MNCVKYTLFSCLCNVHKLFLHYATDFAQCDEGGGASKRGELEEYEAKETSLTP